MKFTTTHRGIGFIYTGFFAIFFLMHLAAFISEDEVYEVIVWKGNSGYELVWEEYGNKSISMVATVNDSISGRTINRKLTTYYLNTDHPDTIIFIITENGNLYFEGM